MITALIPEITKSPIVLRLSSHCDKGDRLYVVVKTLFLIFFFIEQNHFRVSSGLLVILSTWIINIYVINSHNLVSRLY